MANDAARVIGFEPNPTALAELNRGKRSDDLYLPHAVGDGRLRTLHICKAAGMTSLLKPNQQALRHFDRFSEYAEIIEARSVQTVRLDDVPETEGMHYLKMDIQGAELLVLQNATARLKSAVMLHIEVLFVPLYEEQPLFRDVEAYLNSQGFRLYNLVAPHSRAYVAPEMFLDKHGARQRNFVSAFFPSQPGQVGFSQMLWADAIFVKDLFDLKAFSNDQLVTLAHIQHDCYQNYDVALKLLGELDRRTGGTISAPYLAAITNTPAKTP